MGEIMPSEKALPRKPFKTLEALDRIKRLCLGLPVKKIRRTIPWGYALDPENPVMCLPDDKALKCLHRARAYLKESSYVDVSNWLKSCGYPISHWGLFQLIATRPPFDEILLPLEERMKLL